MSREPRPLGLIVRLQIQPAPLKIGEKPDRHYDPAPLLPADQLTITAQGAAARLPDGASALDIHHAAHPATRNSGKGNALSIGFTSHYTAMRAQFGPHLWDGCAGENILVAVERPITLDDVRGGLAIRRAGEAELIEFGGVRVALPCREFSGYAQHGPGAAALKEALQFLDHGMRGYLCGLTSRTSAVIAVGDEVLAL